MTRELSVSKNWPLGGNLPFPRGFSFITKDGLLWHAGISLTCWIDEIYFLARIVINIKLLMLVKKVTIQLTNGKGDSGSKMGRQGGIYIGAGSKDKMGGIGAGRNGRNGKMGGIGKWEEWEWGHHSLVRPAGDWAEPDWSLSSYGGSDTTQLFIAQWRKNQHEKLVSVLDSGAQSPICLSQKVGTFAKSADFQLPKK